MIQRIQSIYLLLAAAFSGGLIFVFTIWTLSTNKVMFALDLLKDESTSLNSVPVLFLGSALLSVISIFLFKNRQTQFVVNRINILINLFLLGMLIYLSLNLPGETSVSKKGIGMFLPILVILLLVIANRAIKKDEDLVKSVDRLR
ncbi:MAG: DUF4293 domain-containing protein [Flavobacteriaceae bacterium]